MIVLRRGWRSPFGSLGKRILHPTLASLYILLIKRTWLTAAGNFTRREREAVSYWTTHRQLSGKTGATVNISQYNDSFALMRKIR